MSRGKRNKSKVPKLTEEEYARYVSSLKEETPIETFAPDAQEKGDQTENKGKRS